MTYYMNRLIWSEQKTRTQHSFLNRSASWVSTWHAGSWNFFWMKWFTGEALSIDKNYMEKMNCYWARHIISSLNTYLQIKQVDLIKLNAAIIFKTAVKWIDMKFGLGRKWDTNYRHTNFTFFVSIITEYKQKKGWYKQLASNFCSTSGNRNQLNFVRL